MPVFIFLVRTSKPLFPILTNFVCLVLALNYLPILIKESLQYVTL